MIIFDLDGTLADCEHRRHFVDPIKSGLKWGGIEGDYPGNWTRNGIGIKWKPDWKAFYEACDKDLPIQPVKSVFIQYCHRDIEIWSGRCESVRKKTEKWISDNIIDEDFKRFSKLRLKMRPIGDNTPDDQLKEKWLNEQCADLMDMGLYGKIPKKHTIDFVFDSDPKSIEMWRRRGIFVFDVNQSGNEF